MSFAAERIGTRIADGSLRHDWTRAEVRALFDLPFPELMFRAQSVHRENFDPAAVQISTLISIKTGGCPEDCGYCPQSARYDTGVRAEKLMGRDAVLAEARAAKAAGASRFCMGAAWRDPKDRDLDQVCEMVEGVKALGLETCATLGMLTAEQARRLKAAGTRLLQPQPRHLARVLRRDHHDAHLPGSAGHARSRARRRHCTCAAAASSAWARRARTARHDRDARQPAGAPGIGADQHAGPSRRHAAAGEQPLDPLEFVRTIAVARITMPNAMVRLSAGREEMSEEVQALCFLAGANSIFYGAKLLTTPIPSATAIGELMDRLGLSPMS